MSLEQLGGHDALTVHEYATTGGITLELPRGRARQRAVRRGVLRAVAAVGCGGNGGELALELDDAVRARPAGAAAARLSGRERRRRVAVTQTTMSHADRIRISPITGCAYDCASATSPRRSYRHRADRADPAGDRHRARRRRRSRPGICLSAAARRRSARPPVRTTSRRSATRVARHLGARPRGRQPVRVDIMMSARPDGAAFVDRMVDAGVTGLLAERRGLLPTSTRGAICRSSTSGRASTSSRRSGAPSSARQRATPGCGR